MGHRKIEAVRMTCWTLWVGGWVGGWKTYQVNHERTPARGELGAHARMHTQRDRWGWVGGWVGREVGRRRKEGG